MNNFIPFRLDNLNAYLLAKKLDFKYIMYVL